MVVSESVEYGGVRWTLNGSGYYSAPRGHAGESFLHRQVCADAHGPIPAGYLVHHLDDDKANNDPANLVAVTRKEHAALHRGGQLERLNSPEWLAHLARIRELAKGWHSTPEGKAWHKDHGRRTWEGRGPLPARPCGWCGKEFSPMTEAEICSNRCHAAKRRASGVDDEERSCVWCGAAFTVNRYKDTSTCSRSCGGKLGRAARAS